MDELQAVSMAVAAKEDLSFIRTNVTEICDLLKDLVKPSQEVEVPSDINSDDAQAVQTYANTYQAIEADYMQDSLQFEYMQTVTGVVIAAVLMLMLGVQLFQTFNKHWR